MKVRSNCLHRIFHALNFVFGAKVVMHFGLAGIALFLISVVNAGTKAPMPPGWIDTSTKISTLSGIAVSCPKESYLWMVDIGPDFSVYHFSNGMKHASSAGFYLGDHPHLNPPADKSKVETVIGKLNGAPVAWTVSQVDDEYSTSLETITDTVETQTGRKLKLHFWLLIKEKNRKGQWLKWAECFHFSSSVDN